MNFEHFISIAPESIRITLVDDLQRIISQHRGWLNQVSQAAILKMPSLSPQIEGVEAHKICSMGAFESQITQRNLHEHPAMTVLFEKHTALHDVARQINNSVGKPIQSTLFETFLIDQYHFFNHMNQFLEVAIRDQAIYHYSSRIIRSQHAEELFNQTVLHLQGLPQEEQIGCIATINVDPRKNIQQNSGGDGLKAAITEIARRLKSTARQSDSVIENDNETLTLIFPGMDINNAKGILSRIMDKVTDKAIKIEQQMFPAEYAIGLLNIDINDHSSRCFKGSRELCSKAIIDGDLIKVGKINSKKV